MTTRHIYVDETKRRDYLLVASVHLSPDLRAHRSLVGGLLLPGQRYLHMKDEKEGRKRTIAKAIAASGVEATVYIASAANYRTELPRRAACLRALVEDQAGADDVRMVIDEDEGLVSWDNQRLIDYTRQAACRETMRYQHKQSHADLLLAFPDAIAWCWAKGGSWRAIVEPIVTVREV